MEGCWTEAEWGSRLPFYRGALHPRALHCPCSGRHGGSSKAHVRREDPEAQAWFLEHGGARLSPQRC